MSNWQYAKQIPTAPWRSAQSLPRTLALTSTSDGIRLVQQPVVELQSLRGAPRRVAARTIPQGVTSLDSLGIAGTSMEIVAELEAGSASEFGLKVRTGPTEETVIGVEPKARRFFIDRTRSGDTSFHRDFSGRHYAPLPIENGRVRLHIFVDWSSVEVFAGDGRSVITEQVFPAPESRGVALYATGGAARLVSLEAWPLASAWTASPRHRD